MMVFINDLIGEATHDKCNIEFATDGGTKEGVAATWGVTFKYQETTHTFADLVRGEDVSGWAAEIAAASIAFQALRPRHCSCASPPRLPRPLPAVRVRDGASFPSRVEGAAGRCTRAGNSGGQASSRPRHPPRECCGQGGGATRGRFGAGTGAAGGGLPGDGLCAESAAG